MAALREKLVAGLEALSLEYDAGQVARLLDFLALLTKWNRAYNLTAIRDPEKMIGLHLLDSLAVLPHLHGEHILDVGTGAGLPGIPLALFAPERRFCLLDSNGKKTRFVRQAALELGLGNVEVVHARVENFQSAQGFDTILTRAFASVDKILVLTRHLLSPGGVVLAMKGHLGEEAMADAAGFEARVIPLQVPQVDGERHLLRLSPRHKEQYGESLSHG